MPAFKYKKEDAVACLPEGDYEASIVSAEVGVSKSSGADMLTVAFKVYTTDGREVTLNDYIVNPKTLFKLKRIALAIGQQTAFENETFDVNDNIGANLILGLKVDSNEKYGDQNKIDSYKRLERAPSSRPTATMPAKGDFDIKDSEIPF